MANLALFTKSPRCLFCAHRVAYNDMFNLIVPFHRQLRRKTKVAKKPDTINVKLLEDITGYGCKGSIIPVAPGRMRNILYPQQKAAYIPEVQLRQMKRKKFVVERDFDYGIERPKDQDTEGKLSKAEDYDAVRVEIQLLSPQRATEVIAASLPPSLVFYRSPISNPEPSEPPVGLSGQHMRPIDVDPPAALVSAPPLIPPPVIIYGSVSSADIAESVKALLHETEDGARVVVGAEDIRILRSEGQEIVETDRLKTLGEFAIDIQIKGGDAIRRTVTIKAEDSKPVNQESHGPTSTPGQPIGLGALPEA